MSDIQPPSSQPAKGGEIPLEDIERLLQTEDPGFKESLEEVRTIETDQTVEIETLTDDVVLDDEKEEPEKFDSRWKLWRAKLAIARRAFFLRLRSRLALLATDLLVFLKTRPKEFALYSLAVSKGLAKKVSEATTAFHNASRATRMLALLFILLITAGIWILMLNLKGIWIPLITEPILRSLEMEAQLVETYDPAEEGESFYEAFPQERHEFLFKPMKVNLKRNSLNTNPMGAFELIVLLDSKDTAIEISDREIEFFDLLQRTLEDETFQDLETELGKAKLKSRIKRELNQNLTQGWVKDVNFKTFVIKP